jgi:hypothetical protein
VTGGGKPDGIARFLSRLGARRPEDQPAPDPGPVELPRSRPAEPSARGPVLPTKALRKFLACLTSGPSPVLLDLGTVVGSNVTFLGESLGCKIHVEDLYADLDRHAREGALDRLPSFLEGRLAHGDGSIDGILCWDLIDYLDRASAQALALELTRVLRVDGALLGFFGTVGADDAHFTKYVIVDDTHLQHRVYTSRCTRQRVLANRDIIKLFEGLRVSDSFLLQTNSREILFRKPSYLARGRLAG